MAELVLRGTPAGISQQLSEPPPPSPQRTAAGSPSSSSSSAPPSGQAVKIGKVHWVLDPTGQLRQSPDPGPTAPAGNTEVPVAPGDNSTDPDTVVIGDGEEESHFATEAKPAPAAAAPPADARETAQTAGQRARRARCARRWVLQVRLVIESRWSQLASDCQRL
jgi:hypothetical protein